MMPFFWKYSPAQHPTRTLTTASLRDRLMAQLIDGVILGAFCSLWVYVISQGQIYSLWVSPVFPQYLLQVSDTFQPLAQHIWWGGYFWSVKLSYGKTLFIQFPSPVFWLFYAVYYTLTTALWGQTPGKMVKRLVVLTEGEKIPGFGRSLRRWLFTVLAVLPIGAGVWVFPNVTLQDRLSRTRVYCYDPLKKH